MKVARWSVWVAALDPVVGSEQGKNRPVLVISDTRLNDILPVVNVLPLTSRKPGRRIYPNEAVLPVGAAGMKAESIVLCYQIRTLDKRRLTRSLGELDNAVTRAEIITALSFQLALNR
jgi:mRNA interferase MazF